MKRRTRKELGRYIVADPDICHGQPTFTGTRIMVKSVLFCVAQGKDWDVDLSGVRWPSQPRGNCRSRSAGQ